MVSLDEKGTITVKDYGGSSWRCDSPRISDRQKIRGRAELVAAYAPHTGRVFYRFSGKKRAYHVTGLLRQVRAAIPKPAKLYVTLDNHHMHPGALVTRFVEDDGLVELLFTPKNASWWNAVEQVFADLQKKVLNNSSFVDAEDLKEALKRRLRDLGVRLEAILATREYSFAFDLWKKMVSSSSPAFALVWPSYDLPTFRAGCTFEYLPEPFPTQEHLGRNVEPTILANVLVLKDRLQGVQTDQSPTIGTVKLLLFLYQPVNDREGPL